MIVISDGDIFKNQVGTDGSPYPLGYDHYTQQTFGNKNLLLNIADYMTDDSGLIASAHKRDTNTPAGQGPHTQRKTVLATD